MTEIKQNTKKAVKNSKIDKIVEILKKNNINTALIYENKEEMLPVLTEYAKKIGYEKKIKKFIK